MDQLPTHEDQIKQVHAQLIQLIVQACQNTEMQQQLEPVLKTSHQNGWTNLVINIRKILAGEREYSQLAQMDHEDSVIIQAILEGLTDHTTLPPITPQSGNASSAAPGLALMIHQAQTGDTRALTLLAHTTEQMSAAGGEMTRVAAIIKNLLDGERDSDQLTRNMGKQAESLILSILEELAKLRPQ